VRERNPPSAPIPCGFDRFADEYAQCHHIGGEDRASFARRRLEFLAERLARIPFDAETVLDFGCGTGSTLPLFAEILHARRVLALEESEPLLRLAERDYAHLVASFHRTSNLPEPESCDLVFCSAVFHHVPPGERLALVRKIGAILRPGGLFAFWEHNAWSPAARYLMSRCAYDRGAKPLAAPAARRLLSEGGFEILATDYLFIFPRPLRWLRPAERLATKLPLGAQYQVLARRS
jgi:SAM-dependent methyltransferase